MGHGYSGSVLGSQDPVFLHAWLAFVILLAGDQITSSLKSKFFTDIMSLPFLSGAQTQQVLMSHARRYLLGAAIIPTPEIHLHRRVGSYARDRSVDLTRVLAHL